MSFPNLREKIANGDRLTEEEVQAAIERSIPLPDEYDAPAGSFSGKPQAAPGETEGPVVQTGPAYSGAPEPGQLESLTKEELAALGEQRGLDLSMSMKKAEMIEALAEE
jgi:hypothetical protein